MDNLTFEQLKDDPYIIALSNLGENYTLRNFFLYTQQEIEGYNRVYGQIHRSCKSGDFPRAEEIYTKSGIGTVDLVVASLALSNYIGFADTAYGLFNGLNVELLTRLDFLSPAAASIGIQEIDTISNYVLAGSLQYIQVLMNPENHHIIRQEAIRLMTEFKPLASWNKPYNNP